MTNKQVHRHDFGGPYELRATQSNAGLATFALYRRDLDQPVSTWKMPIDRTAGFAAAVRSIVRDLREGWKPAKRALHAEEDAAVTPSPELGDNT